MISWLQTSTAGCRTTLVDLVHVEPGVDVHVLQQVEPGQREYRRTRHGSRSDRRRSADSGVRGFAEGYSLRPISRSRTSGVDLKLSLVALEIIGGPAPTQPTQLDRARPLGWLSASGTGRCRTMRPCSE